MNRAEKRRQQKKAGKAAKHAKPGQSAGPSRKRPTPTIRQSLDRALKHYNAARWPEAERLYRAILQTDPNQPTVLHRLGVIANRMGNNDSAVDLVTKALALKPDFAAAHSNLGLVLRELGRLDEAVASYGKALALKPDFSDAHNNLGNALRDQGKLDEAVASFRKALALEPDYAKAHNNLGQALRMLSKPDEAVACYRKALALAPDYADAHNNLGNAFKDLWKIDEAIVSYGQALALEPDFAQAHNNLGVAFKVLGKMDEAAASYHKALAIKPDFAEAHRHLSTVKKFTQYDDDIKAMEDTYALPGLSNEQRMHIAFGLGKSFEDLGRYDKAFGFFQTGNAMKRGTYDYAIESAERLSSNLKTLFTEDFFREHRAAGSSDGTPIFVLGMLRSGTSLVEQILASHPRVHGAGEVNYIHRVVISNFSKIDDAELAESILRASADDFSSAAGDYIGMLREFSHTAEFITDKTTYNFLLIGMIKLMLPNAKIIHCRRDPLDTCLSIFKNYFSAGGSFYAYDLDELGRYYNMYRDLMTHWHTVLPGFIYDIHYEAVVADQEEQSRALLAFCGVEWDDACLEFHGTDRPVHTASAAQVRRPIYHSSVESWRRFEPHLGPLIKALG